MERPHEEDNLIEVAQERAPLRAEEALTREGGVFERLSGKAKKIAAVMALVSGLSFSAAMVREAEAGDRHYGPSYELGSYKSVEDSKERAIRFLDTLANLPEAKRDKPLSEGQIELLKMRAAKVIIMQEAEHHKEGLPGVLRDLVGAMNDYGDIKMKEDDGKVELEEVNETQRWFYSQPGIQQLREMMSK